MKTPLLIILLFVFCSLPGSAQEVLAKIEYSEAEKSFQQKDYPETLKYLEKVKELLGSTNSKVMYLEIMALDKVLDKGNLNQETIYRFKTLKNLTGQYIENFENSVPLEKIKDVYLVQQKRESPFIRIDDFILAIQMLDTKKEKGKALLSQICESGNTLACTYVASKEYLNNALNAFNYQGNFKEIASLRIVTVMDERNAMIVTSTKTYDFKAKRYRLEILTEDNQGAFVAKSITYVIDNKGYANYYGRKMVLDEASVKGINIAIEKSAAFILQIVPLMVVEEGLIKSNVMLDGKPVVKLENEKWAYYIDLENYEIVRADDKTGKSVIENKAYKDFGDFSYPAGFKSTVGDIVTGGTIKSIEINKEYPASYFTN